MVNKFDTQFLIEGSNLDEDDIRAGIMASAEGDCLIVVGDEEVVKVHYHTDTPWKVLEYAASQGDLHKIIVENMERQANGLDGYSISGFLCLVNGMQYHTRVPNRLQEYDYSQNGAYFITFCTQGRGRRGAHCAPLRFPTSSNNERAA